MLLYEWEAEFLRLVVGREGIFVHPHKVEVIQNWPRAINMTELGRCLGLVQFFRGFIRGFSAPAAPLYVLLNKCDGIRQCDAWALAAFMDLKSPLMMAPDLVPLTGLNRSVFILMPLRWHLGPG